MNLFPILTLIAVLLVLAAGTAVVRRLLHTRRGRIAVAETLQTAGWRPAYGADSRYAAELAKLHNTVVDHPFLGAMHYPADIPPPLDGYRPAHADQHSRWRVANLVDPTEPLDREVLLAMLRDSAARDAGVIL